MSLGRDIVKIFVRALVPAVVMFAGIGLVVLARVIDSSTMLWIGLAIAVIGLVWAILSCILHGIDPFDL